MRPSLHTASILLLCLLPGRLAGQQPYSRLVRVVGAIRTAALVSAPTAPPQRAYSPELELSLPPLANRPGSSRRQVFRLNLAEQVQLCATGDWLAAGPVATLGVGVRF